MIEQFFLTRFVFKNKYVRDLEFQKNIKGLMQKYIKDEISVEEYEAKGKQMLYESLTQFERHFWKNYYLDPLFKIKALELHSFVEVGRISVSEYKKKLIKSMIASDKRLGESGFSEVD